ncbi:MAG: hypothetical protein ACOCXH_09680 [Cyclobacteriaceae bacterium]
MIPINFFNTLKVVAFLALLCFFSACETGNRKTKTLETTDEEAADQIIDDRQGWYEEWDANDNGIIENDEFSEMATSNFEDWDMNDDDLLDEEEIAANWSYTFPMDYRENWMSKWDSDGDGNLSQSEFDQKVFEFLDIDDSGVLERDELYIEE